ncbi:hypothetical protein AVEN_40183-1, partial [Araneus ventricosus]
RERNNLRSKGQSSEEYQGSRDKSQRKIKGVEEKVQRKIEEVEGKVLGKIGDIEKGLSELEGKSNNFPRRSELIHSRPTIKTLTFDGQTSRPVFKTQFDVMTSTYGWTDFVKVSQLVVSLRGSVEEILQETPADKLTKLTTIEKALAFRFGYGHLVQFYITELKIRRQKPGEYFQVLVADLG